MIHPNRISLAIASLFAISGCTGSPEHSLDFTPEFSFTKGIEGPAVDEQGNVYAVNFEKEGTIGVVNGKGEGKIFLTLPDGSIGNGIRFDAEGNMFIADYLGHKVYRVAKGSNIPEVWAQDSILNQPNDLTIAPDGSIYLSDPNWSKGTGRIWLLDRDRNLRILEDHMGTTNGIEVSPDGKKLYVNESVQRKVWEYSIKSDGTVYQKKELITFPDYGMDGMRCDIKGNLYITRYDKGTVAVVSPAGKIISEIQLTGKKPSNIAFGGKDGKICYVTMADRGCIETFKAEYRGNLLNKTF